jgi:hypothetical protein
MKKEEIMEALSVNNVKDVLNNILERLLIVEEMLEEKGKEGVDLKKLEKRIDDMLEKTTIEPRKLIMSVDELQTLKGENIEWWKENKAIFELFARLKIIENQWNESKEFDWEDDQLKYCLSLNLNDWGVQSVGYDAQIFNFHKKEHAPLFLETFSKELEIIKPLFS